MPIDLSSLLTPSPPDIRLSGPIFAYDDPVVVGEWDIVAGVVPEPATWAMLLLGFFGLGGMLRASHRKQRDAGVAA